MSDVTPRTQARRATPAGIVETGYQAWLWVDARVASFPREARRSLGHRAVDALLDALACTTEAAYLPKGPARIDRLAGQPDDLDQPHPAAGRTRSPLPVGGPA